MKFNDCQLVNDSDEPVYAAEVWQTDTSPEGAQLTADEGPAPTSPNVHLRFRPGAAGVVHYAVRCGPSPAGERIDELPQREYVVLEHEVGELVTIYGVVRHDYSSELNPEYELIVGFDGSWIVFSRIVLT